MHGERLRRRRLAPALLPRAPPHAEDGRRPRREAREKLAPATAKGDSRRRRNIRGRPFMCFRSERFHVGAFPPSATSNRASTGGGLHSRRVRPERPPSSHFRRPVAGRDRARRSRESGSAVFAGAVSSREIRQRIAPSGGIPTIPVPSAPMLWIATDRSKAATRSPSLSTRARTLLDASESHRRRRPLGRVRCRIPAHIPGRVDILATEASHLNRRAQTSDARRRDGQGGSHSTSTHPHDTPRRRYAQRVVHAPRLGRRRHRKGGRRRVLLLRRREGGWRRVLLLLLPLFSPLLPDLLAPVPRANRARGEEPSSTAPATKETEGRVDAAGGGFSTRRVPSRRPGRRVSRFASFVEVVVDAQLRRVFRRDGAATVQSASVRRGRE